MYQFRIEYYYYNRKIKGPKEKEKIKKNTIQQDTIATKITFCVNNFSNKIERKKHFQGIGDE